MVDLLRRRTAPAAGALVLIVALGTAGCGSARKPSLRTDPERTAPAATTEERNTEERSASTDEPSREISTDRAAAFDSGAGTPAREASLKIVEEGKGYLIAGQAREAIRRFERATRIDPTNGFAYYYLGRAKVANGDRTGVVGVLEKAEALLGPYPEWRDRVAELLASLR